MGEIIVKVKVENTVDRGMFEYGHLTEDQIRTYLVEAIVDTGAMMLMLPQDVVEKLGLKMRRTVVVTYADERREKRPVASPLTIYIGDRFMTIDCIVGPPSEKALIGQIIMEELDLIADCKNKTLGPRPESPIYPLVNLRTL